MTTVRMRAILAAHLAALCLVSLLAIAATDSPRRSTVEEWIPTADARRVGDYCLAEDGRSRSARYTVEVLRPGTRGGVDRASGFRADPNAIPEARAVDADYQNAGFDRGHLAASANHLRSREVNQATFLLSNAVPQTSRLNRGAWRLIEEQIRHIAKTQECVIVTAPLYLPSADGVVTIRTIGRSGVWVPTHCGKAVLIGGREMRAWILPNTDAVRTDPEQYRVSVDEFEAAAGIDVFALLPDDIEASLESAPAR